MSYLRFEREEIEGRKTPIYHVSNVANGSHLGVLAWRGAWRKYVFLPVDGSCFDSSCQREIADKLDDIMNTRKLVEQANRRLAQQRFYRQLEEGKSLL